MWVSVVHRCTVGRLATLLQIAVAGFVPQAAGQVL